MERSAFAELLARASRSGSLASIEAGRELVLEALGDGPVDACVDACTRGAPTAERARYVLRLLRPETVVSEMLRRLSDADDATDPGVLGDILASCVTHRDSSVLEAHFARLRGRARHAVAWAMAALIRDELVPRRTQTDWSARLERCDDPSVRALIEEL